MRAAGARAGGGANGRAPGVRPIGRARVRAFMHAGALFN